MKWALVEEKTNWRVVVTDEDMWEEPELLQLHSAAGAAPGRGGSVQRRADVVLDSLQTRLTWVVTAGSSFAIYPTSCPVCANGCVNECLCWVWGDAHHPKASLETEFPPYLLISSKLLEVSRVGAWGRGGGACRDLSKMAWVKYWTVLKGSVVLEGVVCVWSIGEHAGISSIKSKIPASSGSIHPKIPTSVLKAWLSRERRGSCAGQIFSSS